MSRTDHEYLDFDLEIGLGEGGRLRAQVNTSPAGQAEHEFEMPIDPLELENFVLRVGRTRTGRRRVGSPQYRLAQEVGTRLYDALFAGEVRIAFRRSLDRANDEGKGLRIRLRCDEAPALGQVPWEYLYSPGVGDFLVLSSLTPLVRHLDLPMGDERLAIDPPLRVLVAVASPTDLEELDTERELELVRRAVGDLAARGSVEVETLAGATLQELRRTLRRGTFHVLHFVGHGGFDEQHEDGVLAFEDDFGRSRHISGSQLGTILHDHRSLRLVVLNACEGARTSADDPFSGVAQSLLRRGVPAVVAMQFEITDEAAIAFSHELYLALVEGEPVESAVAEARLEIFSSDNDIEWGTPVLYSRALDGRLFEIAEREVAPDAPPVLRPSELPPPPPRPAPVRDDTPTVELDLTEEPARAGSGPLAASTAPLGVVDPAPTAPTAPVGATPGRTSAPAADDTARIEPAASGGTDDATEAVATEAVATEAIATEGVATEVVDLRDDGAPPPPRAPAPPTGDDGAARVAVKQRRRWILAGAAGAFVALIGIGLLIPEEDTGGPVTGDGSATDVIADGRTDDGGDVDPPDGDGAATTGQVDPESGVDGALPGSDATFVAPRLDAIGELDADGFVSFGDVYVADSFVAGVEPDPEVSAEVTLAWDDEALWLLAAVTDPDPESPYAGEPSQLFRGDSFHFEIGPDPTGLGPDDPLRPSDLHVLAGPVVDDLGDIVDVAHAVNTVSGGVFVADPSLSLPTTILPSADGYVVEVAVPWDVLGVVPEPGIVLGLNLNASDVFEGELWAMVSTNPARDGEAQNHPGRWQTVELLG